MAKSHEAAVSAQEEAVHEAAGDKSIPYVEKCWEVVFAEKSNDNDTTDVPLCVNGEQLVIKRGVPVILPDRFLECADRTKHPIYRQEPNKDRKIEAWIQTYHYSKLREASWDEFRRFKKKGDQIAREAVKKAEMTT